MTNYTPNANISQCGGYRPIFITGKGNYPASRAVLYIPKEFYIEPTTNEASMKIKRSQLPYRVKWNTDKNYEGIIEIRYGTWGRHGNTAQKFIQDSGYYDITEEDLKGIKVIIKNGYSGLKDKQELTHQIVCLI